MIIFKKIKYLKKIFSVVLSLMTIISLFFYGLDFNYLAEASTFTFTQTDWTGGQTANTAAHSTNQNNWAEYSSSTTAYLGPGQIQIATSSANFSETFTAATYQDSGNSTANWNTSSGQLEMTSEPNGTSLQNKISGLMRGDRIKMIVYATTATDNLIFIGGFNNKFLKYDISADTTTDLSAKISDIFGSGQRINSLTFDSVNSVIYLGGYGRFGKYDLASDTATDLTAKISSFWGASNNVNGLIFDSVNSVIYLGGDGGKFAKYNISADTATDLTAKISSFWSTNIVQSLTFDSANSVVYLGGNSGKFAKYDIASDTATDLTAKISSFWSTNAIYSLTFDSVNSVIYLGGLSGKFAKYNIGADTATDLTAKISSFWSTDDIYSLTFDSVNSMIYLGGLRGRFAKYDIGADTAAFNNQISGIAFDSQVNNLTFDSVNSVIYLGGGSGRFAKYNIGADTATDLSAKISSFWWGSSVGGLTFDSVNSVIYLGGNSVDRFAKYDIASDTATDLSAKISSFWGVGVLSLTFDSANNVIYLGGNNGKFAKYDIASDTATNLTAKISSFWDTINVNSLTFDSANSVIHLGGDAGRFAKYDIGADTATNWAAKISSFWAGAHIHGLAFDSVNAVVYFGGHDKRFGKYDISADTATDLTPPSGTHINKILYADGAVYFSTASNVFYKHDTSSDTATNIASTIGNNVAESLTYDSINQAIYIGGASGFLMRKPLACVSCIGQSLTFDATSQNILAATLTKNDTPGTGSVTYALSNDGGATFSNVTPGAEFTFSSTGSDLRFRITLSGDATVQDVTVNYNYYSPFGGLESSKYDSGNAANIISALAWDEDAVLPTGSTAQISLRSAVDSDGLSSASWNDFTNSTTNCSKSSGAVTCPLAAIPAGLKDGLNDQWFQYKVEITSTGTSTPTISEIRLQYVVNAEPEFNPTYGADGSLASQIATTTDANWGKVEIKYSARDSDTSDPNNNTPGYITPGFEYNIGGGWQAITSGYLAAGDLDNKVVDESTYTVYTAIWDAVAQIPDNYTASAQIRVTIDDNEAADNIATSTSAAFELDTTVPSISALTLDSVVDQYTLNASDDTYLEFRLSNNSDLSSDGLNNTSGQWQAINGTSMASTTDWVLTGAPSFETIYLEMRDKYNNTTSTSVTAPSTPTNLDIKDVSNEASGEYRLFVSWGVYTATTSAVFSQYQVYRSTNGVDYTLNNTITDAATNYVNDTGLSSTTVYYYKLRIRDTGGDISNESSVVSDTPDGQGGTDVTAPAISDITTAEAQATWARITWTTNELANSRVDYSVSPSKAFNNSATSSSYVTSHSLTLTGLAPNTTYLYRVRSDDPSGNAKTDDNSNNGYSFTTEGGPSISDAACQSVSDTGATIVWNTDEDSNSYVVYSTSVANLNNSVGISEVGNATAVGLSTGGVFQHKVSLSDLTQRTKYYFYVKSTDSSSNTVTDTDGGNYYSCTTTYDNQPPVISNILTPVITSSNVVVTWGTDELSDSRVRYGYVSGAYPSQTGLDNVLTINHVRTLTGLSPETKYYFQVMSSDAQGNAATSAEQEVTTTATRETVTVTVGGGGGSAPDSTPPTLTNIAVSEIDAFSAVITFDVNEMSTAFVEHGKTTDYGFTAGSSKLAQTHKVKLNGLTLGTDYHFKVKAQDKGANFQTSEDFTFTTKYAAEAAEELVTLENAAQFQEKIEWLIQSVMPSLVPPFISNVKVMEIMENSAVINWQTNVPAFGAVAYVSDNEYNVLSANPYLTEISQAEKKVKNHSIQISNLLPSTLYHLQAKAFSLPGVVGKSKDVTFTTKASPIKAEATKITNTEISVRWVSAVETSSFVEYRNLITGQVSRTGDPSFVKTHSINLEYLMPATAYEISAFGYDLNNNLVQADPIITRTKKDIIPPTISSIKIDNALLPGRTDRLQTVVLWQTNELANSLVYFEEGIGIGEALINKAGEANILTTDHVVIITTLKPSTVYRVQIASVDESGNESRSSIRTILTPRSAESILDIIVRNLQETFGFLKQLNR